MSDCKITIATRNTWEIREWVLENMASSAPDKALPVACRSSTARPPAPRSPASLRRRKDGKFPGRPESLQGVSRSGWRGSAGEVSGHVWKLKRKLIAKYPSFGTVNKNTEDYEKVNVGC